MKPGDIVFYRDTKFGKHRFWEIEGIYLGASGQEGLIGLRSLDRSPGVVGTLGELSVVYVPEPMVRNLPVYSAP